MTTEAQHSPGSNLGASKAGWIGVTGLQCELRYLFAAHPVNRALGSALQRIAHALDARYAVVHARFGSSPLSEEWCLGGAKIDESFREGVNLTMAEAVSDGAAKCRRWGGDGNAGVFAAVMYDRDVEQSGAAAILLEDCTREKAVQVLAQFESLVGFLALLVTDSVENRQAALDWGSAEVVAHSAKAAQHPVHLAFTVAAELKNRYGFDTTAIGFVKGKSVQVTAVCGMDEIRQSNPGIKLIRVSMEECLDRDEAIVHTGPSISDPEPKDDCRVHEQWSNACGGNPVASFPLRLLGDVVGVVSVSFSPASGLLAGRIREIEASPQMVQYGALIPLSRLASRGVIRHAVHSLRDTWTKVTGSGSRKRLVLLSLLAALFAWLGFGELDYSFTVPCHVKAADRRFISCPREGTLADLFVQPGEIVRKGQLLAVLDTYEEELRRLEIDAEVAAIEAQVDAALAAREFATLRVLEATKRSLEAQRAIVVMNIEKASIRAPQPGVILGRDLREQVGARISRSEPMFELARQDSVVMVLEIPESRVLDAGEARLMEFASYARPDVLLILEDLALAPSSTVVNGKNVFLSDANPKDSLDGLVPGMEGVVHVEVGARSVLWVLGHRIVDWLRLNWWI